MLRIEKAISDNAQIISILGRVTFNEAFGHLFRDRNDLLEYLDKTFSVSKIKSSLEKENNVFWVAYLDDLPVGYAKLKLNSQSEFIDSENVCQLQKIYVLNDFLSMKIGLKLQETLLLEAQKQNFDKVWLAVWKGNDRALKFYLKNNFQEQGEFIFTIGKENFDFQVMSKDLSKNGLV